MNRRDFLTTASVGIAGVGSGAVRLDDAVAALRQRNVPPSDHIEFSQHIASGNTSG